ncbi:DUF6206 family protein [uncultured Jatrophihabitans sp.]|uniref:DUF6206 family protein n=1 Tax=uncultured Jatrophihabitans sp. TaxID=1610747 RepID=UPI0035CC3967
MLTAPETEDVQRLEHALDVANPEASGFQVLDSGEVSAVLRHDSVPDAVLKRIGGFPTHNDASRYARSVTDYVAGLRDREVPCLRTDCVVVQSHGGEWATYVVQPAVAVERLGKSWLSTAEGAEAADIVQQIADFNHRAHQQQGLTPNTMSYAIDSQVSNWVIDASTVVALLDVTTPLSCRAGRKTAECEPILRGFPRPLRGLVRRSGRVERVFDVHFDNRSNLVDIAANLIKEGRPDLVAHVVHAANRWLVDHDQLAAIHPDEVSAYYRRNARALELSSKIRRFDVAVHRLTRRPYHAVLPAQVERNA